MRTTLTLIAAAALAAPVLAGGTVTFTLDSPSNGQTVAPGATVTWNIRLSVSTGDNLGLALFAVDLVPDPNNPALDIPPGSAASIPAVLQGFNRPRGITNPGEGGAASGYIGVQRGTTGHKSLVQIGGAQNTFGQAGTGFATDPNVAGGIGQPGPLLVLSGSFTAPSTTGVYTFSLANAVANVLETLNTPPNFSRVGRATSVTTGATITFTVGQTICRGDCNCDGQINFGDINPFVLALTNISAWQTAFPNCPVQNPDVNADGRVDFGDINPFVALLSTHSGPCQ